jgi:predicted nucleotidyltransferase
LIDLRDRAELRQLARIVADIRAHADSAAQNFMLIGAAARDILLLHRHGIECPRRTMDVDFAFSVPDWAAFARLRDNLVASGRFEQTQVEHRLRDRFGTPLDILPFGGVESPPGVIAWPPNDNPTLSVLGYQEAFTSADSVLLPAAQPVAVVSLPMLALLKLFAWDSRHMEQPRKDAIDLLFILTAAPQTEDLPRILEQAPHLFDLPDFDVELVGAWILGNRIRQALDRDSSRGAEIVTRAAAILDRESDPGGPLCLIGEAQVGDAEQARHRLAAFMNGMRIAAALRDAR